MNKLTLSSGDTIYFREHTWGDIEMLCALHDEADRFYYTLAACTSHVLTVDGDLIDTPQEVENLIFRLSPEAVSEWYHACVRLQPHIGIANVLR